MILEYGDNMRRKKKLKSSDISRNSSVQVNHTIKRIKEHEKRYTTLLVFFFLSIFLLIGYHFISIDSSTLLSNYKEYDDEIRGLLSKGELVTLTEKSIISDEEGSKSIPYVYYLYNRSLKNINYDLVFSLDENDIDLSSIKYSINGGSVHILSENNGIISLNQKINGREDTYYNVRMWIDEKYLFSNKFKVKGSFSTIQRIE